MNNNSTDKKKIDAEEIKSYLANRETFLLGLKLISLYFKCTLIDDFHNVHYAIRDNFENDNNYAPGFYYFCSPKWSIWNMPDYALYFDNYKSLLKFISFGFFYKNMYISYIFDKYYKVGRPILKKELISYSTYSTKYIFTREKILRKYASDSGKEEYVYKWDMVLTSQIYHSPNTIGKDLDFYEAVYTK